MKIALSPRAEKDLKKIEKNIDNDESVLEAVNLKIANSFGKLRGEEIAQLQIKSHKHKQDVDEGYKKLETLIAELDELDKLKPL